jgi:serine/threonine protein phosphatase PrpC
MNTSRPVDPDTLPLPGSSGSRVELHGLTFDVAGFSEQGPRSENQDAYSTERFAATGLVAVADGMGGERGGRIAAETALRALLEKTPLRSLDDARRAVRVADRAVASAVSEDEPGRRGMGCALALMALHRSPADGVAWIAAHVGDVRILSRSSDGTVRLETRDHTPAFARWEAGEIELDAVPEAEGANRLQRAVGRGGEADAARLPARPGWAYAIVSDGVTKAMRIDEIGEALAAPDAGAACETIRKRVIERGADDNFTAVVVRIPGSPSTEPVSRPAPSRSSQPGVPPVSSPRRSAGTVVVGLLALLALLAAGAAFWTVREMRESTPERSEVDRLRAELDSLRARVRGLEEPFGPTASPPPESP